MKISTLLLLAAVLYIAFADKDDKGGSGGKSGSGGDDKGGNDDHGDHGFGSNSTSSNSGKGKGGYSNFKPGKTLVSFATSTDGASSSFLDGKLNATLFITTTDAASVSLVAVDKFANDIEVGKHGLTVSLGGSSLGYAIQVTPSSVNVTSASLQINTDLTQFKKGNIGLFYIDPSTHFYGRVAVTKDGNSTVYSLLTSTTSLYFVASIDDNATLPLLFKTPCNLQGGEKHKIEFDQGLSMNITNSANSTLIVTPLDSSSGRSPRGSRAIGVFFDISVDVQSQLNATLSYSFNATLLRLSGVDTSKLRWAVLDTNSNTWTLLTDGFSIDDDTVHQEVGHFSQWAVYSTADITGASSTSANSSGAFGAILSVAAVLAALALVL